MRKKLVKIFLSLCLLFTLNFFCVFSSFAAIPSDMTPYDYLFFMASSAYGLSASGKCIYQLESAFEGYLELINNQSMLNQLEDYKKLSWYCTIENVDDFMLIFFDWLSQATVDSNVVNLPTSPSPSTVAFGDDGVQFVPFNDIVLPSNYIEEYKYFFSTTRIDYSSSYYVESCNYYIPIDKEVVLVFNKVSDSGKYSFSFYSLDSSDSSGLVQLNPSGIKCYYNSDGSIGHNTISFASWLFAISLSFREILSCPYKIFPDIASASKYAKTGNYISMIKPNMCSISFDSSPFDADVQNRFLSSGKNLIIPHSYGARMSYNNILSSNTLDERFEQLKKGGLDVSYSASYTVEHYKQDINGETFTKEETENFTSTVGAVANFEVKDYEGFSYDESLTEPTSRIVLSSNDLTIKLYYTRNLIPYLVEHYQQNEEGTGWTKKETQSLTGLFGADASFTPKTYQGFVYQEDLTEPSNKVLSDSTNLTIKLYYNRNTYNYKIEHYKQNLDGETYVKADTDNLSGLFEDMAAFTRKDYTGFSYKAEKTIPIDKKIPANDDLIIKLYYDRDSHSYTVEHYLQNKDGQGWTKKKVESLTGLFGVDASFTPTNYTGFTFSGNLTEPENRIIPAADNLVIKLYYLRNLVSYSVEHYKQQYEPSGNFTWNLDSTDLLSGLFETEPTFTPEEFTGFFYDSTLTESRSIPVSDGDLIVKLYYKQNPVSYMVEHYTQSAIKNVDGSSSWKLMEKESLTGFPGCLAACPKKNYSGFFYDSSLIIPKNPIIPEDNSLIVKLYYIQDLFGFLKNPLDFTGGKIIAIAASLFIAPFIFFFLIRLFKKILSIGA